MEFLIGPILGVVVVAVGVWLGTASLRDQLGELSAAVRSLRPEAGASRAVLRAQESALGLLDEDRPVGIQEIAQATGLSEEQVRTVVDDLVDRGVLVAEGSHYRRR